MTGQPDHIDQIDICPRCQGLSVTHLRKAADIESGDLIFDNGRRIAVSGGVLYLGPAGQPCTPENPA